MPEDKKKVKEEPEKKPTLPKKPDEKSYPDPLKRFEALKKWREARDKILGHEEVMEWKPKKTLDKADKEIQKVGEEKPKGKKITHLEWIGKRPVKGLEESKKDFGKRLRDWRKREPKLK